MFEVFLYTMCIFIFPATAGEVMFFSFSEKRKEPKENRQAGIALVAMGLGLARPSWPRTERGMQF